MQSAQAEPPLRMTSAEAELFGSLLKSATCYLEWGSGGSTLAAARSRVRHIVSIETDPAWIERLKQNEEIAAAVASKRLVLRHIDVGAVGEWGAPVGQEKLRNWPRYASDPFLATDFNFDFILVDGRFRIHCLLAIAYCADEKATVFLHDYACRHSYTIADKYFDTLRRVDSGVVLRKRTDINYRALYIDLIASLFDP